MADQKPGSDVTGCNGVLLGASGVAKEDIRAYIANYGAHRPGITTEECVRYYNQIADTYEEDLNPNRYQGYVIAAKTVEKYRDGDKDVRILDVGAGTGLLGQELRKRGFTNIDYLDPASRMLEIAEGRSIYKRLLNDVLGGSNVHIADDTYDVLALSGSMGEGHIPCKGLCEMIRIVKPGGLVVIVMREEYLDYVKEYNNRLEAFMEELEGSGQWRRLERSVVSDYSFGKNGVVFAYEVLQRGFRSMLSEIVKM